MPATEVSIDFDRDGVLWVLAREDIYGAVPAVCSARPPYSTWHSVVRPPIRLKGPMIKRLMGGCIVVGRRWDLPGRRNLRTDMFWLPDGSNSIDRIDLPDGKDIEFIRTLPSGGDTSYAGWLDIEEGSAVISYYSSHEHKMDEPRSIASDAYPLETPADIFLADVSYA